MAPSCLVSTVQAGSGGAMVCEMFSWHTFGLLIPIAQRFHATKNEGCSGGKSNQIVFVTYTWLADVNASVAKCLCF